MALDLDLFEQAEYDLPNWAERIDDETLAALGIEVCEDAVADAATRQGWLDDTEQWLNMAQQVIEHKTTPWDGASNVKFPLLTTAALQFHARAHQELLKGERLVKGKVIGADPDGSKAKRAKRVEKAMSNQLLYIMEDWSEDTDRLLFVLPLVGTVFRKTYWSSVLNRPASELVLASDLLVNFYATDWERCRKTHVFTKTRNEIVELQRNGHYLELELPLNADEPTGEYEDEEGDLPDGFENVSRQKDVPFTIMECHGWYDLDEDGYAEPYIITVLHQTQQVLAVVPRFIPDMIKSEDANDTILRIEPMEYITVYKFLPDVESSIYGVGLGKLLGPSNAAIDTIINQLVDAGTLATMPSGLYGRGIRLSRGGKIRLQPGEWKQVNSTGEDLAKSIYPMPVKEPSSTLFQLLGMLIQAGEKMGSVTEALSGENPGQNQPFSTTSAVMEQGMQVFLGIYKRVYRALTRDFRIHARLNYAHMGMDTYAQLLDEPDIEVDPQADFDPKGLDIVPEADPSLANSMRKQRRVQALIEARNAGIPLNDQYIAKIFLEAIDEPEPELALNAQPPPPSPAQLEMERFQKQLEFDEKELMVNAKLRENEPMQDMAKAMESFAKAKALGNDADTQKMAQAMDMMMKKMDMAAKQSEAIQKIIMGEKQMELDERKADKQIELEERKADAQINAQRARTGESS
jgi:chaperonin GroES